MPVLPLVGAASVAVGATVLIVHQRPDEPAVVLEALRLSAVFLAVGLASVWDDPAASTLSSSPRPLLWRRAARLALALPVLVLGWFATVSAAHAVADDAYVCLPRPDGSVAVELAGLSAVGLGVSALASRRDRSHPGTVAAMAIIGLLVALRFVPERWTFLGGPPGSATWQDAHLRWGVVAATAVAVALWAGRDPATPPTSKRPWRAVSAVVLVGILAAAALVWTNRDNTEETLSKVLEQQRELEAVPGLAAAVILPDGTSWTGVVGQASDDVPLSTGHAFAHASITKLYVATLAVALAERGVVDLDAPIGPHLPELGGFGAVTLRQLLSHTSGMVDPDDLFDLFADRHRIWTTADVFELAPDGPVFEPGSAFEYSSVGYAAAATVLERTTGQSLAGLLDEYVLGPVGGRDTWIQDVDAVAPVPIAHAFADRDGDGRAEDLTAGHDLVPWTSIGSAAGGAGGLMAPVDQVARFGRALFSGEVVSAESLQQMEPQPGNGTWMEYGLGLMGVDVPDGRALGHTGDIPGASAELWHLPERGITVAVAMNGEPRCDSAAQALADAAGAADQRR